MYVSVRAYVPSCMHVAMYVGNGIILYCSNYVLYEWMFASVYVGMFVCLVVWKLKETHHKIE